MGIVFLLGWLDFVNVQKILVNRELVCLMKPARQQDTRQYTKSSWHCVQVFIIDLSANCNAK